MSGLTRTTSTPDEMLMAVLFVWDTKNMSPHYVNSSMAKLTRLKLKGKRETKGKKGKKGKKASPKPKWKKRGRGKKARGGRRNASSEETSEEEETDEEEGSDSEDPLAEDERDTLEVDNFDVRWLRDEQYRFETDTKAVIANHAREFDNTAGWVRASVRSYDDTENVYDGASYQAVLATTCKVRTCLSLKF